MLPLLHKYNFEGLLGACISHVEIIGRHVLSLDRDSNNYVLKWLELSERLQLDGIYSCCLRYLQRSLAEKDRGLSSLARDEEWLQKLSPVTLAKVVRLAVNCAGLPLPKREHLLVSPCCSAQLWVEHGDKLPAGITQWRSAECPACKGLVIVERSAVCIRVTDVEQLAAHVERSIMDDADRQMETSDSDDGWDSSSDEDEDESDDGLSEELSEEEEEEEQQQGQQGQQGQGQHGMQMFGADVSEVSSSEDDSSSDDDSDDLSDSSDDSEGLSSSSEEESSEDE
jgi:hypothetical protein